MNGFLARLQFVDKIGFDRAFVEFRHNNSSSISSEEETEFIRSLLDSGTQYERVSILNALAFISAFVDVGKYPRQSVLTRSLYLAMIDSTFVAKVASIGSRIHTKGWIFHALARILDKQMDLVQKTIKENAPIWEYLLKEIEKNALSTNYDYKKTYAERPNSALIEVFPLFWPSENVKLVPLESLIADFCKFCFETKSKTSLRLVSILAYIFPIEVYRCSKDNIYMLSHYAIKQILANCKDPIIPEPDQSTDIKKYAISILPFDQQKLSEIVSSVQGIEDVQQLAEHYDGGKHEFAF